MQLAGKRAGVERDRRLAALKDGPLRHSDRGRAERSSGEHRRRGVEDCTIIGAQRHVGRCLVVGARGRRCAAVSEVDQQIIAGD